MTYKHPDISVTVRDSEPEWWRLGRKGWLWQPSSPQPVVWVTLYQLMNCNVELNKDLFIYTLKQCRSSAENRKNRDRETQIKLFLCQLIVTLKRIREFKYKMATFGLGFSQQEVNRKCRTVLYKDRYKNSRFRSLGKNIVRGMKVVRSMENVGVEPGPAQSREAGDQAVTLIIGGEGTGTLHHWDVNINMEIWKIL